MLMLCLGFWDIVVMFGVMMAPVILFLALVVFCVIKLHAVRRRNYLKAISIDSGRSQPQS